MTTKWRTKKDLPGIPAGTILDLQNVHDPDSLLYAWNATAGGAENHPDFFERVEDEPEFVDVDIDWDAWAKASVDLPYFVVVEGSRTANVSELADFSEFEGFMYEGSEQPHAEARKYSYPTDFAARTNPQPEVFIPKAARFRRKDK